VLTSVVWGVTCVLSTTTTACTEARRGAAVTAAILARGSWQAAAPSIAGVHARHLASLLLSPPPLALSSTPAVVGRDTSVRRATDVEQVPTALRTITREVLGLALEALFVALDESINDKVELDTVVAAERNHRQVAHTLLVWLHKLGGKYGARIPHVSPELARLSPLPSPVVKMLTATPVNSCGRDAQSDGRVLLRDTAPTAAGAHPVARPQ